MIHENLKQLRISKGLSQAQLSRKLNMSTNAYSLLETGKSKFDYNKIIEVCNYFKIDIIGLTGLSDLNDENNKTKKPDGILINDLTIKIESLCRNNIKMMEDIKLLINKKDQQLKKLIAQNKLLLEKMDKYSNQKNK